MYIHGFARNRTIGSAPEYSIWNMMIQRCHNTKNSRYSDYGGRGIFVAQSWRDSFQNFLNDVGLRPAPGMTIERINNDDGYYSGNVKWSTSKDQARNTRRNHWITYKGKKQILSDWARELGISHVTILRRIRLGHKMNIVMSKTRAPWIRMNRNT